MARLTITLESGFVGDLVHLRLDEGALREIDGARTKLLTGYAEQVEVDVEPGTHTISIELPKRGLSASVALVVLTEKALHISLMDGRIETQTFDHPPGFG